MAVSGLVDRYGAAGELLRDNPLPKRSPSRACPEPPAPSAYCCPACGDRITPPEVRRRPSPEFPLGARAFGQEGDLAVMVAVSVNGTVSHPRVVEALPAPTLSYAILEAVRQWEFEPARLDGEPVPYYYYLTVNFDLRQ